MTLVHGDEKQLEDIKTHLVKTGTSLLDQTSESKNKQLKKVEDQKLKK